jgi:hypothetical protein
MPFTAHPWRSRNSSPRSERHWTIVPADETLRQTNLQELLKAKLGRNFGEEARLSGAPWQAADCHAAES